MMQADLEHHPELQHTAGSRPQVEQLVYQRAVRDGLARTPSPIDLALAAAAPGLARAYAEGYQWGVRHRPRPRTLLDKLGLGRRGKNA